MSDNLQKAWDWLVRHDFKIGKRDAARNQPHKGLYMVFDPMKPENGFCIVGDDLYELIIEAYDFLNEGDE